MLLLLPLLHDSLLLVSCAGFSMAASFPSILIFPCYCEGATCVCVVCVCVFLFLLSRGVGSLRRHSETPDHLLVFFLSINISPFVIIIISSDSLQYVYIYASPLSHVIPSCMESFNNPLIPLFKKNHTLSRVPTMYPSFR